MADLEEAFNVLKFQKKRFQNIDYFFTQRTLIEENEYIDKNMNRKIKKNKVTHNFLAINIPLNIVYNFTNKIIETSDDTKNFTDIDTDNTRQIYKKQNILFSGDGKNKNIQAESPMGFDIEIFGDEGYHYKGTITSYYGVIPNFMVPIKGDKKMFVNINYKFLDINNTDNYIFKKYVSFIEVPKRFQMNPNQDTFLQNNSVDDAID
jgi:hypothetical protein